jgi:hypothetical protein
MDHIVELEGVDLAGIQTSETVPNPLEQQPELLLVIGSDGTPRSASLRSLPGLLTLTAGLAHTRRVIAPRTSVRRCWSLIDPALWAWSGEGRAARRVGGGGAEQCWA